MTDAFQQSTPVEGDWERGYAAGRSRNEGLWKGALQELERAQAEIERLRVAAEEQAAEQKLFDEDLGEKQRLIDRLADIIGLPKDQELDATDFELWITKNCQRAAGQRDT